MDAVAAGGDRQELHEKIRVHSQEAASQVKQHGKPNDLIDRLQNDAAFSAVDFSAVMDPRQFLGRAPEQVDEFLEAIVNPILEKHGGDDRPSAEVEV